MGVGCALAALLVRKGEEPELHILAPEFSTFEEVDRSYVAVDDIRWHEENLATGLGARLNELQIEGPVAYIGDDFLPAQMYRMLLADTPSINWVAEDDLLFGLQSHKSARELDLYREAGEISSRALSAFIESLIRGERQSDAAAAATKIIVAAGGGFQRIGCHAGPRGDHSLFDYPLYGYSREAPNPGEMVRAWLIPVFEGYWLDPGRTSVCELKPSPEQKRLIEDGARILEEMTAAIKPGQTARQLAIFGDRLLERYGYEPEAGGYGHGLATFWLGPVIPAGGSGPDQDNPHFGLDIPLHEGQIFTSEDLRAGPASGSLDLRTSSSSGRTETSRSFIRRWCSGKQRRGHQRQGITDSTSTPSRRIRGSERSRLYQAAIITTCPTTRLIARRVAPIRYGVSGPVERCRDRAT